MLVFVPIQQLGNEMTRRLPTTIEDASSTQTWWQARTAWECNLRRQDHVMVRERVRSHQTCFAMSATNWHLQSTIWLLFSSVSIEPNPVSSRSRGPASDQSENGYHKGQMGLRNRIGYQTQRRVLEPSRWPVLLITLLAVHRPSFRRLERHLCFGSAIGTLHGVHLSWSRAEPAIVPASSVVDEDYLLRNLTRPLWA